MKKRTPAGTGADVTADSTNNTAPGPLQKLEFLANVAKDNDLSRIELAGLVVLANSQNSKTGEHWRSFNSWAEATGSSSRQVKRAIGRLMAKGYVRLVRPGTRGGLANVYTLGSVTHDTTFYDVVTPEVKGSDIEGQKVVSPVPPLSSLSIRDTIEDRKNRSTDGDAMPSGPADAALGQRQPVKAGQDMYPEFWAAYSLRAGVANAERIIGERIAAGVAYADIVAGAKRYAEYCRATKQVRRSPADKWLERESWRDEWTTPPKKIKTQETKTKVYEIHGSPWPGQIENPNYQFEMAEYEKAYEAYEKKYKKKIEIVDTNNENWGRLEDDLIDHAKNCDICGRYLDEDKKYINDGLDLCNTGKAIQSKRDSFNDEEAQKLEDLLEDARPRRPNCYIWPDDV